MNGEEPHDTLRLRTRFEERALSPEDDIVCEACMALIVTLNDRRIVHRKPPLQKKRMLGFETWRASHEVVILLILASSIMTCLFYCFMKSSIYRYSSTSS